jgi:hypothetical protein
MIAETDAEVRSLETELDQHQKHASLVEKTTIPS